MSIAANVKKTIDRIPLRKVFGYEAFDDYRTAPAAVVRAVCWCVAEQRVNRLTKGRFYTPRRGILGDVSIGDDELLRDVLFRNGKRCGYVTGPALYNRLGLSTQVPKTITVAANRAGQTKDFGTIRIRISPRRAPINSNTVPLLELLDVLRDAKKGADTRTKAFARTVIGLIGALPPSATKTLQRLAVDYYNAFTRALLGAFLDRLEMPVLESLRVSINPTTVFQIDIDASVLPQASAWNIRCTKNSGSAVTDSPFP